MPAFFIWKHKNVWIIITEVSFDFVSLVSRRNLTVCYSGRKLEILNGKLDELNLQKIDIEDLSDKGLNNLLKLEYAYSIGDTDKKREIVGVVFPDKMEIENGVLRTGRVNEVIKRIYMMDSELPGKKKDRSKINLICPA